jgi:hypothetical protein
MEKNRYANNQTCQIKSVQTSRCLGSADFGCWHAGNQYWVYLGEQGAYWLCLLSTQQSQEIQCRLLKFFHSSNNITVMLKVGCLKLRLSWIISGRLTNLLIMVRMVCIVQYGDMLWPRKRLIVNKWIILSIKGKYNANKIVIMSLSRLVEERDTLY